MKKNVDTSALERIWFTNKCPKKEVQREGKDCQYRDKNPWIPTGRPRVMSHSFT
jgi:hypothetical protein